jgi:hypothetical protein
VNECLVAAILSSNIGSFTQDLTLAMPSRLCWNQDIGTLKVHLKTSKLFDDFSNKLNPRYLNICDATYNY